VREPFLLEALAITGVIVTTLATGCRSEEARARSILDANAESLERCEELNREAQESLDSTIDAMVEGRWTDAEQMHETGSQPAVQAFVECMDREQAALFARLREAGISDDVAERTAQAWWDERRRLLDEEANPSQ